MTDRQSFVPFAVIGTLCVMTGGLVAAVTAPAPTEHGTWAAGYLVLVGGVAQVGLGLGQVMFGARVRARVVAVEVVAWNVGNAAVLGGTLLDVTVLIDAGGVLLVLALALLSRGVSPAGSRPATGPVRWALYAYRLLVVVLLLSIPVGLVLARLHV